VHDDKRRDGRPSSRPSRALPALRVRSQSVDQFQPHIFFPPHGQTADLWCDSVADGWTARKKDTGTSITSAVKVPCARKSHRRTSLRFLRNTVDEQLANDLCAWVSGSETPSTASWPEKSSCFPRGSAATLIGFAGPHRHDFFGPRAFAQQAQWSTRRIVSWSPD